jgi:hypothetical protein
MTEYNLLQTTPSCLWNDTWKQILRFACTCICLYMKISYRVVEENVHVHPLAAPELYKSSKRRAYVCIPWIDRITHSTSNHVFCSIFYWIFTANNGSMTEYNLLQTTQLYWFRYFLPWLDVLCVILSIQGMQTYARRLLLLYNSGAASGCTCTFSSTFELCTKHPTWRRTNIILHVCFRIHVVQLLHILHIHFCR